MLINKDILHRTFSGFYPKNSLIRLILFFGLLLLIAFWPMLIGNTLSAGDNFSLMVPGKVFTAQWLKTGTMPLWNPYLFGGIPWAGDINQSVWYPGTLLFLFFHPAVALNLSVVMHLLVALLGTYLLCFTWTKHKGAALAGAVIFAFSPQVAGTINNIASLQSLSWMPWVVWASLHFGQDKKWRIYSIIFLVLQILSGYPHHVVFTLLFAGVASLVSSPGQWREWFKHWLIVGLFSLGLTAIAWLPFLETVQQSTRLIQTTEQRVLGSLHPVELAKLIVPNLFDYPRGGVKWGLSWSRPPNVSLYFTWLFVLVGALYYFRQKPALKNWVVSALGIFGIMLALGKYLPGSEFFQALPFFGAVRGPSTALMMSTLAGSLIFSQALVNVSARKISAWVWRILIVAATLALAGLVVNYYFFDQFWLMIDGFSGNLLSGGGFHTLDRDQLIARVLSMNVLINSLACLAAIWFWQKKQWILLALVVGLDLILNTQGHYQFTQKQIYDQTFLTEKSEFSQLINSGERTLIRNYNAPYTDFGAYWDALTVRRPFSDSYIDEVELKTGTRQQAMRYGLTPDWNQVARVPAIGGYTTLMPQSVDQLFGAENDPSVNDLPEITWNNPLLARWSVRWYLVDQFFPIYEGLPDAKLVADQDDWLLYELPYLPRIRFADDSLAMITDLQENPNVMKFVVENPDNQPALLIADRFDKDWQVQINGRAGTINDFEGMRLIPLEPGTNEIRLRYAPKVFYYGLGISSFTLIVGAMLLMKSRLDS